MLGLTRDPTFYSNPRYHKGNSPEKHLGAFPETLTFTLARLSTVTKLDNPYSP